MLEKVKNVGLIRGNSVVGIQATFHSSDRFVLHLIKVKKHLGKISIEKQALEIGLIESIREHLQKNIPVVLCIDGKNVIHKYVTDNIGNNPLDLVLPNASKDDFYVQKTEYGNGNYLSVIRREVLDNFIDALNKLGIIPATIYLGPFVVSNTNFLFAENTTFSTELWTITASNEQVKFTPTINKDFDFTFLNGDSIRGCLMPVYSLSICYLANISIDEISISTLNKDNFIFKRAVWLTGWCLLIAVFAILLVNFMVFSHYNRKYEALSNTLQQHQSLLSRNEDLKDQYTKKRKFIERSGLLNSSRFSYYCDRIAQLVPDSIQLTSLQVFPVDSKIRSDKPIVYGENKILVAGNCSNSRYFNNWKDNLKLEPWLRDIYINQFGQEQPDKPIFFEIILDIK